MEQLIQTILSDKLYLTLVIILIVFIVLFIIKKLFKWLIISLLVFIAFLIYAHYKGESIKDVLKKTKQQGELILNKGKNELKKTVSE